MKRALFLLALLLPHAALALDWTPEQVWAILAERIDTHEKSIGIAVGLIDEEESIVVGYGKLGREDDRVPDGKTVFEIGSISKVFTGILLADMVERGLVGLDDPVRKHLRESVTLPEEITLYHLTTHTSGLPRMPGNFVPADPSNPYADYTVERMYEFLSGVELQSEPGKTAAYSNLGTGLLGHVLSLRAGTDYEGLVRERIAGPLGMDDTVVTLTPQLRERMAQGHDAALKPTSNWDIPTLAGAGALRSTVDDMLLFLAANIGLKETPVSKAMATSHEPREPIVGGYVGLGWIVQEGGTIHWHNGGTGGYRSFAGFDKERKLGVVVLSNASISADDIGLHLLDPSMPLARFREAEDAIELDPKVFDAYVGRYQLRPHLVITVLREDSKYYAHLTGRNRLEFFPESETRFFATATEVALSFHDGHLVLHQDGAEIRAPRITEHGTLIVLNKSEATASLIDAGTGETLATVPTGTGPHEAAVSPDGRTAVIGNYGNRAESGSTLTVVDVNSAEVLRTIELTLEETTYHRPHGLAFLDDKRMAVTCEAEEAVLIVDVEAGTVESAISTGQQISHMLALSPDGRRAFVANIGSGTTTVLDLAEGKKLADVETGAGAEGIAVSPDGREVWVTNRAADTVSVLDAGSLEIKATIETAGFPIRAAFTPDGKHVLVSLARAGEVAVLDAAERKIARKVSMEARAGDDRDQRLFGDRFGDSPVPIGILIPPKGDVAYVANTNADVVTVIDLATWEIRDRLTAGKEPDGMAWSPLATD